MANLLDTFPLNYELSALDKILIASGILPVEEEEEPEVEKVEEENKEVECVEGEECEKKEEQEEERKPKNWSYSEKKGSCVDPVGVVDGFVNLSEPKAGGYDCTGACRTFETKTLLEGNDNVNVAVLESPTSCYIQEYSFSRFHGKCKTDAVAGLT